MDLLLTEFEKCDLAGFWARDWERSRLEVKELLAYGVRDGLLSSRQDFGQAAGESIMGLAATRDLKIDGDVYGSVVHTAALADLVCTALRKPQEQPWQALGPVKLGNHHWISDALLEPSGEFLRRVVFVSSWNNDRHYSVLRSWGSLGAVCVHQIPMQIAVVITGQFREGKFRSPWVQGFRHPMNKVLRLRKKHDVAEGFKSSWRRIWREDYDDISTSNWYEKMIEDNVLQDCLFKIDLPVPAKENREMIIDLAVQKLDRIYALKQKPAQNLSTCDWPSPCQFRSPCHAGKEPNGRFGFVRVDELL